MESLLIVIFFIGAGMHTVLAPLHIFMPGELVHASSNGKVHPAMRHFLAVLGAAHGAFAAALVAATFLSDSARPLFACVLLTWYAILGPIVDAMRLESPPTLWDCLSCCFAGRTFASADKDGDGEITREEWKEAQRKGYIRKGRKFEDALHLADRDKDGRISIDEFKNLHRAPTLNFPIVNATVILALVADTGLSKYTLCALATMFVGLICYGAIIASKSESCGAPVDDDEEEDEEEVDDHR